MSSAFFGFSPDLFTSISKINVLPNPAVTFRLSTCPESLDLSRLTSPVIALFSHLPLCSLQICAIYPLAINTDKSVIHHPIRVSVLSYLAVYCALVAYVSLPQITAINPHFRSIK